MTIPLQRIEVEAAPAPRLEIEQPLVLVTPPRPARSALGSAAAGVSVLGVGFALLGSVNFVVDEFARSPVLGWLSAAVAAAGATLLATGVARELRGLLGLSRVDRLRAALNADHLDAARAAARRWLATLAEGAEILPAIAAADSVPAIRALLQAGPLSTLRLRTDALSRMAALQSFVATAAVPSAWLDGLFVLWRGLRLVRQVAELHGLRPGTIATLALLRRSAFSAAAVVTTDVVANTALNAIATHPLLRHVAGDVAGAGVGARRLFLLGRATALACSPTAEP